MFTLSLLTIFPVRSAPTPTMYVDPEIYNAPGVGRTFTINITVAEVTDLWGWTFELFYNSTHLNGTDVGEGPFLKTAGETFFYVSNLTDNYNATHGYVRALCILTHVIPGPSGTGVIANITFKTKARGSSVLELTGTKLKKSNGDYITHETRNGTIVVKVSFDFDDDGDIDEDDLWYFCAAFIDYYKIHVKDPLCDFDEDCDIDEDDLWAFCEAFLDYWKAH
jgi:hypothetical protein